MSEQPQSNDASDGSSSNDSPEPQPFELTLPDDPKSQADWYLWAGVLALLALVAFWPVIQGGFIWDDEHYVTQNLSLQSFKGLVHLWIPPIGSGMGDPLQTTQYYPLLYTLLWIEHHLWQDSAMGYHVVNLLMHAAGAVVLWRVLRRLELPGAWVAAGLWAVHPLQAESVCWISEGKNVLSGLLGFSSLLFYLKFCEMRDPAAKDGADWPGDRFSAYVVSLVFFIAALFAKTVVSSLVPAIVVILWWKNRAKISNLIGLVPMSVIGLIMSSITAHRETDPNGPIQAIGPAWHLSFIQHILLPARDFWFYLGKLAVPINLSFNYPRIVPSPSDLIAWIMLLGMIAVVAVLYLGRDRFGRGPLTAVLCFIFALIPSMGFVNVFPFRYSYVADHFQYLAGVPMIALLVAGLARLVPKADLDPEKAAKSPAVLVPAIVIALVLVAVGSASWMRAGVFVDSGPLWADALQKNPQSWQAASLVARTEISASDAKLSDANDAHAAGDTESETADADQAAQLLDDAQAHLQQAIDNPQSPGDVRYQSYNELGTVELKRRVWPGADVLLLAGRATIDIEQAIEGEKKVEEDRPDASPYLNMGNILSLEGDEARKHLPLDPATMPSTQPEVIETPAATEASMPTTRPATEDELAVKQKYLDAREYFAKALNTADRGLAIPNVYRAALQSFGLTASALGRCDMNLAELAYRRHDVTEERSYLTDAVKMLQESLEINSKSLDVQDELARCLQRLDRWSEAVAVLTNAVEVSPNARMFDELGLIYLNHYARGKLLDDTFLAWKCFSTANDMAPDDPLIQAHLARAEVVLGKVRAATQASTDPSTEP
jgi:tetratricopeptide (TPR) repeat protein